MLLMGLAMPAWAGHPYEGRWRLEPSGIEIEVTDAGAGRWRTAGGAWEVVAIQLGMQEIAFRPTSGDSVAYGAANPLRPGTEPTYELSDAARRLVGHWTIADNPLPNRYRDIHWWFGPDAAFLLLRKKVTETDLQQEIIGGRFEVVNGELVGRTGRWLGHTFRQRIDALVSGASATISWLERETGTRYVERYRFAGADHPLKSDELSALTLVGKWLYVNEKTGRRIEWNFKPGGRVYQDLNGEYSSNDYKVLGNQLLITSPFRTQPFTVVRFERGRMFTVANGTPNPDMMIYVEGPHSPVPVGTGPPTGQEAVAEMQRMMAIHQRRRASMQQQQQSFQRHVQTIRQVTYDHSQMLKGIAFDLADRPSKWVWPE
ncbi:MAG: hypothetical protein ACFCBW_11425 [Candidatus Competibacterales bacterium]